MTARHSHLSEAELQELAKLEKKLLAEGKIKSDDPQQDQTPKKSK